MHPRKPLILPSTLTWAHVKHSLCAGFLTRFYTHTRTHTHTHTTPHAPRRTLVLIVVRTPSTTACALGYESVCARQNALVQDGQHMIVCVCVYVCVCVFPTSQGVAALFPPCLFDDGRPGRGSMAVGWEATSGKFGVAARMLALLWEKTDDKYVPTHTHTHAHIF